MDIVINQESFSLIVERWLKSEEDGEQFPVDFDTAWQLAGYATKASAKRAIEKYMEKDTDYLFNKMLKSTGGRGSEVINLTCDALKELCMLSRSDTGKSTRKYFIEAEKKWKLVQTNFPQVASEVEMIQLKIELAKLETKKADIENKTLNLRNTIVKTCSEPVQQKILGYSVIEKVEYRDRVILNNQVINEGNTLNKTELCHRYGILTKNGKPDYRRLNTLLDHKGITERSEAWEMSAVIQENYQFKREYLPVLDSLMINGDRQLFICE